MNQKEILNKIIKIDMDIINLKIAIFNLRKEIDKLNPLSKADKEEIASRKGEIDKNESKIEDLKTIKKETIETLENEKDRKLITTYAEMVKLNAEVVWLQKEFDSLVFAYQDPLATFLQRQIAEKIAKINELEVEKNKLVQEIKNSRASKTNNEEGVDKE